MARFYKFIAILEMICLTWWSHEHNYAWMIISAVFALIAIFMIGED